MANSKGPYLYTMKVGLFYATWWLCLLVGQQLHAQNTGNTYALVVGISQYAHEDMPQLQFAHRDAAFFAAYLQSKTGGSVPRQNIELLLNEQATYAAIYDAMYQLLQKSRSGDRVYFYFSGHGDVETKLIDSPGFLLASNTTPNNYMNRAVRLEDLNKFTRTLSTINGATVILITDACRSGKLAGDGLNGRQVIGRQLQQVQENEVRLASCQPHELSAEGPAWGGGRGAFSYYLLEALQNAANTDASGSITFATLKTLLPQKLATDRVLLAQQHQQTPVLAGPDRIVFTRSAAPFATTTSLAPALPGTLQQLPPLPNRIDGQSKVSLFMNTFQNALPDIVGLYNDWEIQPAYTLPQTLLHRVKAHSSGPDTALINTLLAELESNSPTTLTQFERSFVNLASSLGQQYIAAYLRSDSLELEKRAYYSDIQKHFAPIIGMYDIALQWLPANHFLHTPMLTDKHYFAALAARLRGGQAGAPKQQLQQQAYAHIRYAMHLEPYAAYLHNELGNLQCETEKKDSGIWHFKMAAALAPTWGLPLSNLAGVYIAQNKLKEAGQTIAEAKILEPRLQLLWAQEAILAEKNKNWLLAETLYWQLLQNNQQNFYPFERLGTLLVPELRFATADSLLHEAALRQTMLVYEDNRIPRFMRMPSRLVANIQIEPPPFCPAMRAPNPHSHAIVHFLYGWEQYQAGKPREAQGIWEQGLRRYPQHPYLNHYYAQLLVENGNPQAAIPFLQMAIAHHQELELLLPLLKNSDTTWRQEMQEACMVYKLKGAAYTAQEDKYRLAGIYQSTGYYTEAAALYENLTLPENFHHHFAAAWLLWANMCMEQHQYSAAEQILHRYQEQCKQYAQEKKYIEWPYDEYCRITAEDGPYELAYLYEKACRQYPANTTWHTKAAHYWIGRLMEYPPILKAHPQDIQADWLPKEMLHQGIMQMLANEQEVMPGLKETIPFALPMKYGRQIGIKAIEKAIGLAATTDEAIQLHLQYAHLLNEAGLYRQSIAQMDAALQLQPSNHSVRNQLALAQQQNGQLVPAYAHWDTLYNIGALLPAVQLKYLLLCIKRGNSQQVSTLINTFSKKIQLPSQGLNNYVLMHHLYQKDYKKALSILQQNRVSMGNAERAYCIAICHAGLQQSTKAIQALRRSLAQGWTYSYILQAQPEFDVLRLSKAYQQLIQAHQPQYIVYQERDRILIERQVGDERSERDMRIYK